MSGVILIIAPLLMMFVVVAYPIHFIPSYVFGFNYTLLDLAGKNQSDDQMIVWILFCTLIYTVIDVYILCRIYHAYKNYISRKSK